MDIDELIERILPCIERHADGRNATTLARRRAIVRFFHFCSIHAAPVPPDTMVLLTELAGRTYDYVDGQDRLLDLPLDHDTADRITQELKAATRILTEGLLAAESARAAGDLVAAAADAAAALRQVFDWYVPGHLRAFVFAETGEWLADGLLDKERSLLIAAVRQCAKEFQP